LGDDKMKAGFSVGVNREKKRLVLGTTFQMMEEFMAEHNINNPQDVMTFSDLNKAEQFHKMVTELLVRMFHGSTDPSIVSIARNTNLFEPRGMAVGDFDGDLGQMTLVDIILQIRNNNSSLSNDDEREGEFEQEEEGMEEDGGNIYKLEARGQHQYLKYVLAGNSIFTIRNSETGNRFTYKVTKKVVDDRRNPTVKRTLYFVKVLTGKQNTSDYSFLGTIFTNPDPDPNIEVYYAYSHSSKSKVGECAQSAIVFRWFFEKVIADEVPECIEFYHTGRCLRCGRLLTVPESIEIGYGTECIKYV
jgi:hypothetical protein